MRVAIVLVLGQVFWSVWAQRAKRELRLTFGVSLHALLALLRSLLRLNSSNAVQLSGCRGIRSSRGESQDAFSSFSYSITVFQLLVCSQLSV